MGCPRNLRDALVTVVALVAVAVSVAPIPAVEAADTHSFPVMQPDDATFRKWMRSYNAAPTAVSPLEVQSASAPGGAFDLLSRLDYVPSERSQGSCSNCWAWAGTGCLEVALNVQAGILDRLSVQYINSCQYPITGNPCCDGGWLGYDFVGFYDTTGICLPWSNSNAGWQDRDAGCNVACNIIATEPHYDITNIAALTIPTHLSEGVPDDGTAIANIKAVVNSGKAVWFAYFVPSTSAWSSFTKFWLTQGEDAVCDLDAICSGTTRWGGHAVLCVGYNDSDPDNRYWIMLNSWGTAGGVRPNGLFRVDMDMDYNTTCSTYAFYWQTLDVSFGVALPPALIETDAATEVDETSARLNGRLMDDSGFKRQCRFAYGTSSGGPYERATGWQPEMTSGEIFLAEVDDLPPGTPCYFAAQSYNVGTMDCGEEEAFLTKPLPPQGFSAWATGETSAVLTWTPGAGADRTIVRGRQGSPPTGPEDGYVVYDGSQAGCTDSGLAPGSKYYYRAWSIATDSVLGTILSDESSQDCAHTIGNGFLMEGDANLDAQVNVADAVSVLQYSVHLRELNPDQMRGADITDDGRVSVADAVRMLQFTVDPTGVHGILPVPLWQSPEDDSLLDPLNPCGL